MEFGAAEVAVSPEKAAADTGGSPVEQIRLLGGEWDGKE